MRAFPGVVIIEHLASSVDSSRKWSKENHTPLIHLTLLTMGHFYSKFNLFFGAHVDDALLDLAGLPELLIHLLSHILVQ